MEVEMRAREKRRRSPSVSPRLAKRIRRAHSVVRRLSIDLTPTPYFRPSILMDDFPVVLEDDGIVPSFQDDEAEVKATAPVPEVPCEEERPERDVIIVRHNLRREVRDKGRVRADAQSQTSPSKDARTRTRRAHPTSGPLPSLPKPRPASAFWVDDPKLFPLVVRTPSLFFFIVLLIYFLLAPSLVPLVYVLQHRMLQREAREGVLRLQGPSFQV